jgi:hypothetical protein
MAWLDIVPRGRPERIGLLDDVIGIRVAKESTAAGDVARIVV